MHTDQGTLLSLTPTPEQPSPKRDDSLHLTPNDLPRLFQAKETPHSYGVNDREVWMESRRQVDRFDVMRGREIEPERGTLRRGEGEGEGGDRMGFRGDGLEGA
jgi:hypothetical protein